MALYDEAAAGVEEQEQISNLESQMEGLRKEARSARATAAASLALAAVGAMAVVAAFAAGAAGIGPYGLVRSPAPARADLGGAVDLSFAAATSAELGAGREAKGQRAALLSPNPGPPRVPHWYRSYLRTEIRTKASTHAAVVAILPPGTLLWVSKVRGDWAYVLKPLPGWVMRKTAGGVEVLRPDLSIVTPLSKADMADESDSARLVEANTRLGREIGKLTALRQDLLSRASAFGRESAVGLDIANRTSYFGHLLETKAPEATRATKELLSALQVAWTAGQPQRFLAEMRKVHGPPDSERG